MELDLTLSEAIEKIATLSDKIDTALENEVAKAMKDAIQEEVMMNVYEYDASPVFMENRRGEGDGGIADEASLDTRVYSNELTITDTANLQNLFGGSWSAEVAAIVQLGSRQFNQPYPRPFLTDALKTAKSTGALDDALAEGLKAQGIEVD